MKIRDIKIRSQLMISLGLLMLMIMITGALAYYYGSRIHDQIEVMYDHPFEVRKTVGELKLDITTIQRDMRELIFLSEGTERDFLMMKILHSVEDADRQISILRERYLGPPNEIDSIQFLFHNWNDRRIVLLQEISADYSKGREVLKSGLENQTQLVNKLMFWVDKVSYYAENKSTELESESQQIVSRLNKQLFTILLCFLILGIIVFNLIANNIRKPLMELNQVTLDFHNGNLDARSSYSLKNEFGTLSALLNELTNSLQHKIELKNRSEEIERAMLSENDIRLFFKVLLSKLVEHTHSNMAAVYFLNADDERYDLLESIGINDKAKRSFSAIHPEGEFGNLLSTGKIQHIKEIPEDSRYRFETTCGNFVPSEIITAPVYSGEKIIAVISMASLGGFDENAVALVNEILFSLSLRIEGILSYQKVKNISEKLEVQNRELEMQKTELVSQSAMLTEQNVELETQKKQLAEASRLKTNFLSNMSHELRTPLNSVIALTSVLERRIKGKIPEEEYGYLDVIGRNGKHLLSLINDILDISRIEAGREEIRLARFNMVRTVNDIIGIIQPQARQKDISLEFTFGKPECLMLSDEEKVRHILLNIIGNAVKFTGEGHVAVQVSQQEEQCKICVRDTGIGIAEEHLPYIFDEFRQAEESTSRRFGGTGLGLALAKKYSQMLGGSITVKSTPGVGSEFCLFLPLEFRIENPAENIVTERIQESGSLESEIAGNAADPDRKSILLVEDSEPAVIQIKDFLEESGYEVVVARSGEEAIRAMAIAVPSALILDLMMPGIDGFQVLDIIRGSATTAKVPVLILTSKFVTKEELGKLKQNNIYQIIRKGDVDLDELLRIIRKMVSSGQNTVNVNSAGEGNTERKSCVLVVEDNPDNMLAVTALLSGKYKILEAVNGESGVELARKHKPDFILMDMNLPGIKGIEAFKIIRNIPELSHIPVIALTASAMSSDKESLLAEGFNAFIAKPIDEKDFFKTINETLYGR